MSQQPASATATAFVVVVPEVELRVASLRARFPGVPYLAPQPAAPFVALTEALVRAFPQYPPFGGAHDDIVPHLTVAQGD